MKNIYLLSGLYMNKKELISYINSYLEIDKFVDDSKNGLQVDNTKDKITKIWYAVDATSYIFDKAIQENIDLLIVHHGLFWGGDQPIVGVQFDRIKKLLDNDIALAGYHLPLDAHKEVGNNAGLLQLFIDTFNIREYDIQSFVNYRWNNIWYVITFSTPLYVEDVIAKYCESWRLEKQFFNFWDIKTIKSVAFCSGWALEVGILNEVKQGGYDLYITWEGVHYQITYAKELKQSILLWGHYETEKFWPRLLANHLKDKFWIEIVELDEKY